MVSVIIPSFNYGEYLRSAIESVLNQTYNCLELIIVDDGSSDNSLALAQEYAKKDKRVRLFTHPNNKNCGLSKTLQMGIEQAEGDWIVFLESDDWLEETYLEEKIEAINEAMYCCVVNFINIVPEEGIDTAWQKSYVPRVLALLDQSKQGDDNDVLSIEILKENLIPTFSCVMLKRSTLQRLDWNTPVEKWLDWYLWIQLLQTEKIKVVNLPLTNWRIHKTSFNSRTSIYTYLNDLRIFRKGVRKFLIDKEIDNKSYKIAVLDSPCFFLLLRRFYLSCKIVGFSSVLKQAFSKFGLRKI